MYTSLLLTVLSILIEIRRVVTITGDSVANFLVISASRLKLYFSSIYINYLTIIPQARVGYENGR